MAQEIGVAFVSLLPSARGFGKAVEGQVDDAIGKSEKRTDGFFTRLGKGVKRVALGVATVGAGVAALAIGGGISRALNIEDAQAKLKGLGHDTKSIEAIMTNALAAVKGTAFGLDAAATTAAAAVASGIKPGQELERYLRLTADAATIAGVSMEEMGSIINKVQAKGKAQMEDLNRLTERGIPIMQILADEYGVTAEEMSKMVSRGEVDAERFRKALEDNVGGAALESGNTTRGAFANMMAALSRLGLVFVEDALGGAKTFFNEVTVILDGLAERLQPWVDSIKERLGGMFEIEGMGDRFLDWFDRTAEAIANGPIPRILEALAPIIPAIAELAAMIGGALGDALLELADALAPILPEVAEALAEAVVELAPALSDLLVALIPLIPPLVELLVALTPIAVEILEMLIPALRWLIDAITPTLEMISLFADQLSGDTSMSEYAERFMELGGVMGETAEAVFSFATTFFLVLNDMQERGSEILGSIRDFFQTIWDEIELIVDEALNFISEVVSGDMSTVEETLSTSLDTIGTAWETAWTGMEDEVSTRWDNMVRDISRGIDQAVEFVRTLPQRILNALGDAGNWLVDTGKNIVRGMIRGIRDMFGDAIAAVQELGAEMLDQAKSFLGIQSPSRVFRDEVGKMVGLGLLAGVEDTSIRGRIDTAVQHMVQVPAAETGRSTAGGVVQNNYFDHLDPMVAVELSEQRLGMTLRGL